MARLFITGFVPQGDCVVGVVGFLSDRAAGVYTSLTINNIPFDPQLAASARQQVQDAMVGAANTVMTEMTIPLTLIASDIEYIS